MKKILLMFLITILFINMGCEKKVEYDHKSKGWVLWATGVVDKKYIVIDGSNRTFFIDFEGELKFKTSRLHNFNDVKEKTKGSIYKYKRIATCYYMWVPDNNFITIPTKKETIQTPVSTIVTKPKINNTEILILPTKYEWQNIKSKQPSFDQVAIVKFKNGIITIAYYERPGIWKSEIDRNKLSGGIALKNVVQWKLVDLK